MASFWKKLKVGVTVIVVAVLLIILLIFLAANRNQVVAKQAMEKLMTTQSMSTEVELELNLPPSLQGRERPLTDVVVRVQGDVLVDDDGTPELSGILYNEARGRGNIFFADGQIKILSDKVMFRLDNLPVFLNPSGSLIERWTDVDSSLLKTSNGDEAFEALKIVLSGMDFVNKEKIEGERLLRFSLQSSAEIEGELEEVFKLENSDNLGLDVIARLIKANDIKRLDVWVNKGRTEVRRVEANFVRILSNGSEYDFATLTMKFDQYGKEVVIERPAGELTVRPEVFAKMFGSGELESVE